MFWLVTLRPVIGHPGFFVDPGGRVWSHWYRGSKGATRPWPHPLKPTRTRSGYHVVNVRGRVRLVHQLVAMAFHGRPPQGQEQIDHRNRDRTDNRASNLRWCTRNANNSNVTSSRGSSSKYLGVCWDKRAKRFVATAMADGRKYGGRMFLCEEAAALYRDHIARAVHGEHASLNFPGENSGLFQVLELLSRVNG